MSGAATAPPAHPIHDPARAYLRDRGIDTEHHLFPGGAVLRFRDVPADLRPRCFPKMPHRNDGGDRHQQVGGFARDRLSGLILYKWQAIDGDVVATELEGVDPDGCRVEYVDAKGKTHKRHASSGIGIGSAAFVVRPLRPDGDTWHVCEGAIDALSVDPLGLASPSDGIIAAHGHHALPKLAPWLRWGAVRIYPHHLDHADVGEVSADELAALVGNRATVYRSTHTGRHDLNDELMERAPRRRISAAAAGESITISGAEFVKMALLPPDDELVPDAPGLAYRGRAVLLHSDRGKGKTTYSAFLVVRATRAGLRVLMAVDDDPASWAARLGEFGADLDMLRVAQMRDLAAAGALEREAAESDLTLIDSWRRWLRASTRQAGKKGAANDESVVGPVADRFVEVAHAGPAVVMLTNQAKGPDGQTARGSVSLEDAVDAIRTCVKVDGVTTIRTAEKARHGIPEGPWHMRLTDDGFTPSDGGGGDGYRVVNGEVVDARQEKMDEGIRLYLSEHPEGVSTNQVERAITGRAKDIRERLKVIGARESDRLWRVRPDSETYTVGRADAPRPEGASAPASHCRDAPGRTASRSASQPTYRDAGTHRDEPRPETDPRDAPGDTPEPDPIPQAEADAEPRRGVVACDNSQEQEDEPMKIQPAPGYERGDSPHRCYVCDGETDSPALHPMPHREGVNGGPLSVPVCPPARCASSVVVSQRCAREASPSWSDGRMMCGSSPHRP